MNDKVKSIWEGVPLFKNQRALSIIALVAIVAAIPLTVFIAQRQQEIRQRASVPGAIINFFDGADYLAGDPPTTTSSTVNLQIIYPANSGAFSQQSVTSSDQDGPVLQIPATKTSRKSTSTLMTSNNVSTNNLSCQTCWARYNDCLLDNDYDSDLCTERWYNDGCEEYDNTSSYYDCPSDPVPTTPPQPTNTPTCPPTMQYSTTTGQCVCNNSSYWYDDDINACVNPDQWCESRIPNTHSLPYHPWCACDTGYLYNTATNACVPGAQICSQIPNAHFNGTDDCDCNQYYHWNDAPPWACLPDQPTATPRPPLPTGIQPPTNTPIACSGATSCWRDQGENCEDAAAADSACSAFWGPGSVCQHSQSEIDSSQGDHPDGCTVSSYPSRIRITEGGQTGPAQSYGVSGANQRYPWTFTNPNQSGTKFFLVEFGDANGFWPGQTVTGQINYQSTGATPIPTSNPTQPDLVATNATLDPPTPAANTQFTLRVAVRNAGGVQAVSPAGRVRVHMIVIPASGGNTITSWYTDIAGGLAPNETKQIAIVSTGLPAGAYSIWAFPDYESAIPDANVGNNTSNTVGFTAGTGCGTSNQSCTTGSCCTGLSCVPDPFGVGGPVCRAAVTPSPTPIPCTPVPGFFNCPNTPTPIPTPGGGTTVPTTGAGTPTTTPVPGTPVPTGTLTFSMENLLVKFQGILADTNTSPTRPTKQVKVLFVPQGQSAPTDPNAGFTGTATPEIVNGAYTDRYIITGTVNLNLGTYDLYVKGPAHLRKKIGTATASGTASNATLSWTVITIVPFLAGNVVTTSTSSNTINGQDISYLYGRFGQAVTVDNKIADLNDDGVINSQDISLINGNFGRTGE